MRLKFFFSRTLEKLGRTCDQIGRTLEPCYRPWTGDADVLSSGGVLWAQVHRDRSLYLGNARVPPGSPDIEGSKDAGDGRAASGRERGHPRLCQVLMHPREERHQSSMLL